MPSLDQTLIHDAAPLGSLRYFALLYTPKEQRAQLAALFLVDSEIRASARAASHDVAHMRLQWWREEIARLKVGSPQHPATRTLSDLNQRVDFAPLFEVLTAAEQDLANVGYENEREIAAYLRRSGGSTAELAATILASSTDRTRENARELGIGMRRSELLRDLRQDAHDGRIYFALAELERANVRVHELRQATLTESLRKLVLDHAQQTRRDLAQSAAKMTQVERINLRPLLVLASLHARLLDRLQRESDEIPKRRIDLGPLEKVWTSWRAALRANVVG